MKVKEFYTTKETANYLGVSTSTIYRMEKKGLITFIKISKRRNGFSKKSIERYLKERQNFKKNIDNNIYKTRSKRKELIIKETKPIYHLENAKSTVYHSDELFFRSDSIYIYNTDILKIKSIKENSIDLIVTSPPYNVDIKYNSHNDALSYDDYLSFTREWLSRCYKFLKDDGRFCLNIPLDKNKGGQQSVYADITNIAKQIGFKYHSTIIWNEQNISRRTAWGSWLSAAAPYVIAPVEVIVVLYKKYWKKNSSNRRSDMTKREFVEWTNGVWSFMGESKKRVGHPAPFPVELPKRCIKLFSFVGDTILDPFLGSGTTLLACLQTNRIGIGVDIDNKYCELAKKRLLIEGQINQLKLDIAEGKR